MSDGSKEQPEKTAGLNLGDKCSHPSVSSTQGAARWSRKVGCAQPPKPF
jgi:hypothetical protein